MARRRFKRPQQGNEFYSPVYQDRCKRESDRISRNRAYRLVDSQVLHPPTPLAHGGGMQAYVAEATRFFAMKRRDAETYDLPSQRRLEFFGPGGGPLVTLQWTVPLHEGLMVYRSLPAVLQEWTVLGEFCADGGPYVTLSRVAIEVAPGQWDGVPDRTSFLWKGPAGRRMAVEFNSSVGDQDTCISFTVPEAHGAEVHRLWKQLVVETDKSHYLRGQRFTANMTFLTFEGSDDWSALVLPSSIKELIQANTIHLLRRREAYAREGVPLRRGIILHGPPGTGKTMVGRALAQSCGCTFILATPAMIPDGEKVRALFTLARRLAPAIVFLEDLDLVASDRHRSFNLQVLGELLAALDGLDSAAGVIVVATTNDLAAIEPALKDRPSRFDLVLEIPPLDQSGRVEYLTRWLSSRRTQPLELEAIAEKSRGFTGAQMQELCRSALISAIERAPDLAEGDRPEITVEDMHVALDRLRKRMRVAVGFQGL